MKKRKILRISAAVVAVILVVGFLLSVLMLTTVQTIASIPHPPKGARAFAAGQTSARALQNGFFQMSTTARAMCTMDMATGRVFYEHNADAKLPLASTTKIVTAITVIEAFENAGRNLDEKFKIDDRAIGIEGTSIYLKKGEQLSARELLLGLMLRSGNDAANALALSVSPNIPAFAAKMNETSGKAGAENSSFKNPHGLDEEGHFTTARDLAKISAYAMKNPTFAEIVGTRDARIDGVDYPRILHNKNRILRSLDGCCGVKTGFTKKAGRCFVGARESNGQTAICVVLNCGPMFEESAALLTAAAEQFPPRQLLAVDTFIDCTHDCDGVCAIATADFFYPLADAELEQTEIRLDGEEVVVTLNQKEIYRTECNVL
jgi:D-alanyl-D-alanine carboxypeptidase